jgi:three-Cys-motif partner protein
MKMNKNLNIIKSSLLQHSQAKVTLYGEYLSIYLNILSRTKHIDSILLFDLLCGEGLYKNNLKGSPLVALDKIKDHFVLNKDSHLKISLIFNDNGFSEITDNIKKVKRLKTIVEQNYLPSNLTIEYHDEEFEEILFKSIERISSTSKSKALFFIDPYGYKNINPKHIKTILSLKSTEVILFLPASHMYRFANKCLESPFCGSEPLHDFLTELYCNSVPSFSSVDNFIYRCREQFKDYLAQEEIFVDSFVIERDKKNTYCLFFFTSNILGFEKMLEAKWKIDTEQGKGFKYSPQMSLFSGVKFSDYPKILEKYLKNNDDVTNKQIYRFGLDHGYLPKHSNEVLKGLMKSGKLEIIAMDGKPTKGLYVSYRNYCDPPDRRVAFRVKSK